MVPADTDMDADNKYEGSSTESVSCMLLKDMKDYFDRNT